MVGTSPSHPLEKYVGTYQHPGYGTIEVRLGTSGLEARLDQFQANLRHYHYDVFELVGDDSPLGSLNRGVLEGLAMFHMNKKGKIDRVGVPLEPNVADIVFERSEK